MIRGGNSDILSAETVEAMQARRDRLDVLEVPDEGHAPALVDAGVIARISAFMVGNGGRTTDDKDLRYDLDG